MIMKGGLHIFRLLNFIQICCIIVQKNPIFLIYQIYFVRHYSHFMRKEVNSPVFLLSPILYFLRQFLDTPESFLNYFELCLLQLYWIIFYSFYAKFQFSIILVIFILPVNAFQNLAYTINLALIFFSFLE